MILVKTELKQSAKHRIGLFAAQFISKGTKTWEYAPLFDSAYTEKEINKMSPVAKEQFFHYAFYDKSQDKYVLCFDDQRFINHSHTNPNITSTPHYDMAARDIEEGEELLCDYNLFDDTYFKRRGIKKKDLK